MQIAKINVTIAEAVEEIDIGGVTLIRAAAKNRESWFYSLLCPTPSYGVEHD